MFSSCVLHPHYVCEYVSDENLYLKSLENKLDDFVFDKYTVNENIFVFKPEATLCYCDSKNESKCRFLFTRKNVELSLHFLLLSKYLYVIISVNIVLWEYYTHFRCK